MKPDHKVAQDIHRRSATNVPRVPVQAKDPQISDLYKEVHMIRRWVVIIGIAVIVELIGVVLSIFFSVN